MQISESRLGSSRGMTLVELMVTTTVLGIVLMVVSGVMLRSSRVEARTMRRAEIQSSSRQAVGLMTLELRHAGADPSMPPVGVVGVVAADSTLIRVRADLNGDGAIQTAEPSEDVTYLYNDTTGVVTRNPGSGPAPIASNVTDMRLTYFDAANQPLGPLPLSATNAARVTAIALTITSENQDSRPITLATRITLRNR